MLPMFIAIVAIRISPARCAPSSSKCYSDRSEAQWFLGPFWIPRVGSWLLQKVDAIRPASPEGPTQ